MSELKGRTALVTGSSRGIGAAIARVFAANGASVAVHGRDPGAVAAVSAEINQCGARAVSVLADLTRYEEVEAMRESVEAGLGPVDLLVANAGGSTVRPGPVEDISEADWNASIEANLTSTFLTIKAFLPGMKQRGKGTIITMSSAAARRPTAQSPAAYTGAKAAIEVLTRQVAVQAGPHGVRANCLAPETILTERNRQQIPAAVQDQLRLSHPVQRLGTPEDVAQAALFLASDRSGWVSGVTLDIAGGSVLA
ncbi:MAG TPA: SDR family NAD(P)-dependent oxidoreductase [Acidimicrobiales bacterium]|nr:SDR family NAD(P)-dependent oxidoreductase [Acidimicrobiales bacterium]